MMPRRSNQQHHEDMNYGNSLGVQGVLCGNWDRYDGRMGTALDGMTVGLDTHCGSI